MQHVLLRTATTLCLIHNNDADGPLDIVQKQGHEVYPQLVLVEAGSTPNPRRLDADGQRIAYQVVQREEICKVSLSGPYYYRSWKAVQQNLD